MPHLEILQMNARDIASKVQSGQLAAERTAEAFAQHIENHQLLINSHIEWDKAHVLAEVDKQIAYIEAAKFAGKPLPLAGVPIAIKDNILVEGQAISCGSRILQGYRASYDATVIQKLRSAGALLFGRTNLDEFAMGSSSEHSAYGPTLNPWNRAHVAGGSSGGSAAAVAAGFTPLALGSDTGGSVRQPAAFCGVVGLKPSYGRVSRYGLVAYASSLDQIGTLARDVQDTELLYRVIAGYDEHDGTSYPEPSPDALKDWSESLKGKKIAFVKEFMGAGIQDEVQQAFAAALASLKEAGAELHEISIPSLSLAIPVYYIIASAEASSNLARFDGIRYGHRSQKSGLALRELYQQSRSEGFGREVKQRIMLGTYVLSSGYYDAYYAQATKLRELLKQEFNAHFQAGIDAIVSPTSPVTAFPLGQNVSDPLAMYLSDIYTIAANLLGIPALSLPMGRDHKDLPIGLQWMAPAFQEEQLLRSALVYERKRTGFESIRPGLR